MIGHSAEDGSIPVPDMSALIARLEAAEAGRRELDAAVTVALRLDCRRGLSDDLEYLREVRRDDQCAPGTYWFVCRSGMSLRTADPVTTSLDAALALAGRVLGLDLWKVRALSQSDGGKWFVSLVLGSPSGTWSREVRCEPVATPALALCIAILRAIPNGCEAAGEVSPNLKAKPQGEGG